MSVINDMLRDLEERKAPEREQMAGSSRSLVAEKQDTFFAQHKLTILLSLIIVLLAAGLVGLFFKSPSAEQAIPVVTTTEEPYSQQRETNSQYLPERLPAATEPELKVPSETSTSQDYTIETSLSTQTNAVPTQENRVEIVAQKPESKDNERALKKTESSAQKVASANTTPSRQKVVEEPSPVIASEVASKAQVATEAPVASLTAGDEDLSTRGVTLTPIALDQAQAERSRTLIENGNEREAIRSLYQFIESNEQHEYSRLMLATALMQQQRTAELADALVVVDETSLPQLRQLKARWYASGDQLGLAVHLLEQNAPALDQNTDYFSLLASYYQQQGQYRKSVDTYSALLEFDSDVPEWWVGMAIGLDRLERYDDARLAYRQALALPKLKKSLAQFSTKRLRQLGEGSGA